MKPLVVSSGEPAGIGPDLCLDLASLALPVVVIADKSMLLERAKRLKRDVHLIDYVPNKEAPPQPFDYRPEQIYVLNLPCVAPVTAGKLDQRNAAYVLEMLRVAVKGCQSGEFSGLVTAPVHKGIINQAGIFFTGHTEFLAKQCGVEHVVMMLACDAMKVALMTTHIPLKQVSAAMTPELISQVVLQLHHSLKQDFALSNPRIVVAGLNPHAGEGGYLGTEERDVIQPTLIRLREQGIHVDGPLPADTLFTPYYLNQYDVFLTMYHDQGLPVLKYAGFGNAVNVTLGLPIVRTSVDHGTALDLAGTGKAESGSLIAAVHMAMLMVKKRRCDDEN